MRAVLITVAIMAGAAELHPQSSLTAPKGIGGTFKLRVWPSPPAQFGDTLKALVIPPSGAGAGLSYRFCAYRARGENSKEIACSPLSTSSTWTWRIAFPYSAAPVQSWRDSIQIRVTIQSREGRGGRTRMLRKHYPIQSDTLAQRYFAQLIGPIITHPRCTNCHAAGDGPTQDDDRHPHVPAVNRSTDCRQCHGEKNGTTANSPPGAKDWHIAPAEMPRIFAGRSPAQICRLLKDPARNGGLTVDQVIDHVETDPLLAWAYQPGPGRTPPPSDWHQMVALFKTWRNVGAACPPLVNQRLPDSRRSSSSGRTVLSDHRGR